MNWQLYEELVKYIYEQLGKSSGVEILGWGPSCKIQGKYGEDYQIDVLTSHSDGVHTYKTAIECKFWNKKVGKDPISKLLTIIEETEIDKGVIVSKLGFTRGAQLFADRKNISLVELREPVDSDWDSLIKDTHVNLVYCMDEIYDVEINLEGNKNKEGKLIIPSYDVYVHINKKFALLNNILNNVINANTSDIDTDLSDFFRIEKCSQKNEEKTYDLKFPENATLAFPGDEGKYKIREMRFKVRQIEHKNVIEIHGEDYVSMIMDVVFENKKFVINKDGTVYLFPRLS